MNKDFIPYKEALQLKELGFNEPCFAIFHRDGTLFSLIPECSPEEQSNLFATKRNSQCLWENDDESLNGIQEVAAPLYQQAFRWFRKKHNLIPVITTTPIFDTIHPSKYKSEIFYQFQPFKWVDGKYDINNTYEEAELDCLRKLIKIVKTKS